MSSSNKPIDLYFSGAENINQLKKPIVLIGGVHGDEPEGVYLAEKSLEWLFQSSTLNLHHWILIPCLNPDGYEQNERVNGRGVDLNRNYPSKDWSPHFDNPRYNPGSTPSSEPEIKALVSLLKELTPNLIIHCHSWEPCIVCSGPPNLDAAKHLSHSSGFKIVEEIGYPTPGSLSSYAWHDNQIPVICIEDEEHRDPHIVWPRFGKGIAKVFSKLA